MKTIVNIIIKYESKSIKFKNNMIIDYGKYNMLHGNNRYSYDNGSWYI